ncbi:MAG: hypothetical protein H7268_12710 [Sandarakinorhabdus sp.]|nr:hypothetical protein [Sandarakinorhabdus sp.]
MLTRPTLFAAAAALLALSGCGGSKVETEKANKGTKVSISIDGSDADHAAAMADASADVNIAGDTNTGKVEIKLPGGLQANVDIPEGMTKNTKFDIDGVGLYPGAKVASVKVNAAARKHNGAAGHSAVVNIGFTAPADAAAVADWYQQQFEAKKIAVRRTGESLAGKTDDGDDFTLSLAPATTGSTGVLTIIDAS